MTAKQGIKDILCLGTTIYGLSNDGTALYEWKLSFEKKKSNEQFTITTCNYKANIYQVLDKLVTYLGFCDVPSTCGVAAMYFVDKQCNNDGNIKNGSSRAYSIERTSKKNSAREALMEKFKKINVFETEKIEQKQAEINESKESGDPKEKFITGVKAFKSYLSQKRATNGKPPLPISSSNSGVAIQLLECPLNESTIKKGSYLRGDPNREAANLTNKKLRHSPSHTVKANEIGEYLDSRRDTTKKKLNIDPLNNSSYMANAVGTLENRKSNNNTSRKSEDISPNRKRASSRQSSKDQQTGFVSASDRIKALRTRIIPKCDLSQNTIEKKCSLKELDNKLEEKKEPKQKPKLPLDSLLNLRLKCFNSQLAIAFRKIIKFAEQKELFCIIKQGNLKFSSWHRGKRHEKVRRCAKDCQHRESFCFKKCLACNISFTTGKASNASSSRKASRNN